MAKVLQNSYYIYKIPSDIVGSLGKYSFSEASRDGNVVSIGDNLVLAKLREYYGVTKGHVELYNEVQDIRAQMKTLRKEEASEENAKELRRLQRKLDRMLFVDDIVNVKIMKKRDYQTLGRKGFDLNGKHYVRFMVGSGQMRRNTISFINEELLPYMQEQLMCGLNGRIAKINLAKLSAYFALSFSSVYWVREPRVCVIKDFETTIKDQSINWIEDGDAGEGDEVKVIKKDVALNSADGQGLISPEMAALWAEDMQLDYTPCSFIIRTAFIKGNLVTFDFKEYAREHGIKTITDRYGTTYNIEDVDVLISESQFKMVKFYSSWEAYLSYHKAYNLKWGVARYNKQFDDEYVLTNYQYLQVLDLDQEDVGGLVNYTAEWIKKICSGELEYALAYNVGPKNEGATFNDIFSSCGSTFTKAIVKNPDMLKDGFVQRKIYNAIKESIRQAKIGRIWVQGNYQFMISDPVAQCRSALGLSPDGLLKSGEVYSNFWNERGESNEVALLRSPLTYYSEVNIEKLANREDMKKWYKHIYSGIIYNIYDISVCRHADSDFDGDIVCSTNNPYFLKGARRDTLPITYEKQKVPSQKITLPNFIRCDLRGLNTKVGQITNYSTSMLAMLPLFDNDKHCEEYNEIQKRLKLLRRIQGDEIDKIKGTNPPNFPKEWLHYDDVLPEDDEETKLKKYKRNSMVVKKKPYFFIYLYNSLMQDYKEYEKNFNNLSLIYFQTPIKKLLAKEKYSEKELDLIRKYRKYSPVLETNCVMNNVCRTIENIDFDIKFKPNTESMLPSLATGIEIDEALLGDITEVYRAYKANKKFKTIDAMVKNEGIQSEEMNSILHSIMCIGRNECRKQMFELCSSAKELFEYLIVMCRDNNWSYDIVWDILQDDILDIIPKGATKVLVEDAGGFEYLGKNYSVKEL